MPKPSTALTLLDGSGDCATALDGCRYSRRSRLTLTLTAVELPCVWTPVGIRWPPGTQVQSRTIDVISIWRFDFLVNHFAEIDRKQILTIEPQI